MTGSMSLTDTVFGGNSAESESSGNVSGVIVSGYLV